MPLAAPEGGVARGGGVAAARAGVVAPLGLVRVSFSRRGVGHRGTGILEVDTHCADVVCVLASSAAAQPGVVCLRPLYIAGAEGALMALEAMSVAARATFTGSV